ncbi:MAG: DUF3276 family protein [Bacteroidales bacterium]|nr:DUF3276 family protein [Bacteroidales bacterium]
MDFNSNRDYNNNREFSRQKEELYSQSISAGKRKYFFDVKETRGGDKFIVIAESRKLFDNNTGNFYFEKNKMFLYKEDFDKFQRGLSNALHFIETGEIPEPVVSEQPEDNAPQGNSYPDVNVYDGIDFNI